MVKHLLFMPDGNRRYSKKKGISLKDAYHQGGEKLELFIDFFLLENKWDQLTMHFMSKYTHERTDGSLKPIYDTLIEKFIELHDNNYFANNRLKFIYLDHSYKLPEQLEEICKDLEDQTRNNPKIVRNLLGYGLETDEKDAFDFATDYQEFCELRLIPQIDLVVRTTEMRLSKGPVYAMSQAQMILANKLNPELERNDLIEILDQYNSLKDYRITTNPVHTAV
ncbi:MAG: undecaprenyl diphosphate synthase family protein [Nanoarchaeota archaeon]|nr:undecaprenyl diphosphate synthase family protein [Nanoarchaeota archaeon]